jgi:ankyrin repeat protein
MPILYSSASSLGQSSNSSIKIFEVLVTGKGVDVNQFDETTGLTPLLRAVSLGLVENVRVLVEKGMADTSIRGKDGLTAFEFLHKKLVSTNKGNNSNNIITLFNMMVFLAKVFFISFLLS